MSFLFRGVDFPTAAELIPRRSDRRSHRSVSAGDAMRHSAVWAALRLRADLVSSCPVDAFREVGGITVEIPKPMVLVDPGGSKVGMAEWLYSTQVDLDRFGNCYGLITARDGLGFPARIELLDAEGVTVKTKGGQIVEFRHASKTYDPSVIWHEKQYTVAGVPLGLSPIAHAAMAVNTYLSAAEFAATWFDGGAVPSSHLKNTAKVLTTEQADSIKSRFKASVSNGDVFVTGQDWDYQMLGAKASEAAFLEAQSATGPDIARWMGVPARAIDAAVSGQSVTYENLTDANLDLLIMNMGPVVARRQAALSTLLPKPRFVRLNVDAVLLRMDPTRRAEMNKILLESRQRVPSEVREKDDLPPFTPEQLAEMTAVYGPPKSTPTKEPAA